MIRLAPSAFIPSVRRSRKSPGRFNSATQQASTFRHQKRLRLSLIQNQISQRTVASAGKLTEAFANGTRNMGSGKSMMSEAIIKVHIALAVPFANHPLQAGTRRVLTEECPHVTS
jgi:hypothetical protein